MTGEIFADGTVGPVGGVEQKVSAVKRAGIKVLHLSLGHAEGRAEGHAEAGRAPSQALPGGKFEEAVKVLAPNGIGTP